MALAVISGGTRGIGRSVALRFAQDGFNLAFFSRNKEKVEAMRRELQNDFPEGHFLGIAADAASPEQVKDFGKKVLDEMGTPDVLVNNAGIFLPGSIGTEQEGTFEDLWLTNVSSAYHLTRTFYNEMRDRKAGHIFNICSIASIIAYPNGGSYTITKFALLGMTKVLREELKPHGIRVTAVLPGATLTDSWSGSDLPSERFIPVEAIAESIFSAYKLPDGAVVEEIVIRPQLGDI